jgi:hypothetical protein
VQQQANVTAYMVRVDFEYNCGRRTDALVKLVSRTQVIAKIIKEIQDHRSTEAGQEVKTSSVSSCIHELAMLLISGRETENQKTEQR